MKNKEWLVTVVIALFVALGAGVSYLLDSAVEPDAAGQQAVLGNLTLTEINPTLFTLTGDVGVGDCERIISQLPTTQPFTLVLESPGGSLQDGVCIAAHLKARNVVTVVRDTPIIDADGNTVYAPGSYTEIGQDFIANGKKPPVICASACSLMFVGGDERHLIGDVNLGIHSPRAAQPITDGSVAESQAYETAHNLLAFLENTLGVVESKLRRLFIQVPAASMYYVNPRDFAGAPWLVTIATHYVDFFGFNAIDPRASVVDSAREQAQLAEQEKEK